MTAKIYKTSSKFFQTIKIDACSDSMDGVWGNTVYTTSIPDAL